MLKIEKRRRYLPVAKIFIIVIILFNFAFAQNVDSLGITNSHLSLQYQIGQNFHIDSFTGNFISIKYKTSNNLAYVLGIGGSYLSTSGDSKKVVEDEIFTFPGEKYRYDIGFYFQVLYQIKTSTRMFFYFGLGPFVGTSYVEHSGYSRQSSHYPWYAVKVWKYEKKYAGCSFNIGGEYFILKKISIIVESSLEASYLTNTSEEIMENSVLNESTDLKGWEVDTTIKFGFAFHFNR